MMPERIGIIGNTQGVSARARPKTKNAATVAHSPPAARIATTPSSSETGVPLALATVAGDAGAVDAAGVAAVASCRSTVRVSGG